MFLVFEIKFTAKNSELEDFKKRFLLSYQFT